MNERAIDTDCVIAGGGPAGVMLGYLLARAGVVVVVLEKWPDFFRDFRGDTIHPSTMTVLDELGLLQKFLALPHRKVDSVSVHIAGEEVELANLSRTRLKTPYIAFMPQWDFLTFMAQEGKRYAGFQLRMNTAATDLLRENGRVVGVRARDDQGELSLRAKLVVGADGRHSTVRDKAGFSRRELGAPMDVLWFRISRQRNDGQAVFGVVDRGHLMILIDRGDYWQCGFVIPKGHTDTLRAQPIETLRAQVAQLAPQLATRTGELRSWDDVKTLSVAVDRLACWHAAGVVCIGDAAHAMSPIGGVGINLAIQDAVAAANILGPAFSRGAPTSSDLAAIQARRTFPTVMTQRLQLFLQNNVITPVLSGAQPRLPLVLRLLRAVPLLTAIPAYLIGVGVRPEHVAKAPE